MAWRAMRDAAATLRSRGDLPAALLQCEAALAADPDEAGAAACLAEKARCLLQQGDPAAALPAARRAARLAPQSPEPFVLVGRALAALGREDAAAVWLRQAQTLGYTESPGDSHTSVAVTPGSVLGYTGGADDAENDLQVERLQRELAARTQAGVALMRRLYTAEQRTATLDGRVRDLEEQQRLAQRELQALRRALEARPPPPTPPPPGSPPLPEGPPPPPTRPAHPTDGAPKPRPPPPVPPPATPAVPPAPSQQIPGPQRPVTAGKPASSPTTTRAAVASESKPTPPPPKAPADPGAPPEAGPPRVQGMDPAHPASAAAICDVIRRVPTAVLCDKVKDCFVSAVQAEARSTSQALQLYMVAWLALQEWLTSHEAAAQPLAPLVEALLARISALKARPKPGPAKPRSGTSPATSPNATAPKANAWAKPDALPTPSPPNGPVAPPGGVADTLHAPTIIRDAGPAEGEGEVVVQPVDGIDCRPTAGSRSSKADLIVDSLSQRGFAVCDFLFTERQAVAIREKVRVLEAQDGLYSRSEIWVGKSSDVGAQLQVPDVRGDSVCWMSPDMIHRWHFTALEDVMAEVDGLVLGVLKGHPSLPELAGLYARSDPMLAVYPGGGARFQKHIDNSAGDGRKLTAVSYLNPHWQAEDEGSLRIHLSAQHKLDVLPIAGRVVLFYSERIPHEVLPACRDRHAFTVWYYDRAEHERAKATAKAVSPSDVPEEARVEARDFIKDTVADTGGAHPLEELRARARRLSPAAARVIAGVVGAANPEEFLAAMDRLTPASLGGLRASFQQMGL